MFLEEELIFLLLAPDDPDLRPTWAVQKYIHVGLSTRAIAHRELIHISTTNGSNYFNINSCTTVNMILFMTDMLSPVGHVVKKAIEQPMKTIEQALHILFSGKRPERRTIDSSV